MGVNKKRNERPVEFLYARTRALLTTVVTRLPVHYSRKQSAQSFARFNASMRAAAASIASVSARTPTSSISHSNVRVRSGASGVSPFECSLKLSTPMLESFIDSSVVGSAVIVVVSSPSDVDLHAATYSTRQSVRSSRSIPPIVIEARSVDAHSNQHPNKMKNQNQNLTSRHTHTLQPR